MDDKNLGRQLGAKVDEVSAKAYPLEIESVGYDTYIVMSKGHHDLEEFMREAVKECPCWFLGGPCHRWVKSVPDRSGRYSMRYAFVAEGTRGAWPATYCQEYGEGYREYNCLPDLSTDNTNNGAASAAALEI